MLELKTLKWTHKDANRTYWRIGAVVLGKANESDDIEWSCRIRSSESGEFTPKDTHVAWVGRIVLQAGEGDVTLERIMQEWARHVASRSIEITKWAKESK